MCIGLISIRLTQILKGFLKPPIIYLPPFPPVPTETAECTEGEVRLAEGSGSTEGRVEVCQWGLWTSVCADESWNDDVAKTICSQLGYTGITTVSGMDGLKGIEMLLTTFHSCTGPTEPFCSISNLAFIYCDIYFTDGMNVKKTVDLNPQHSAL